MVLTVINVNAQIVQNVNDIPIEVYSAELINHDTPRIVNRANVNNNKVGKYMNSPENEIRDDMKNMKDP